MLISQLLSSARENCFGSVMNLRVDIEVEFRKLSIKIKIRSTDSGSLICISQHDEHKIRMVYGGSMFGNLSVKITIYLQMIVEKF